MLQPIERQAFEFAYNEYKEFISIMHDIFPQDPAYSKVKDYVQFETVLSDAKILYHTNDPVLDIDNIIKTFGNRFVEIPLNSLMCNEIENLYPKIGQKIKQNELTNLKITEDKQKQCNKEIYNTEEIEQLFIEK